MMFKINLLKLCKKIQIDVDIYFNIIIVQVLFLDYISIYINFIKKKDFVKRLSKILKFYYLKFFLIR